MDRIRDEQEKMVRLALRAVYEFDADCVGHPKVMLGTNRVLKAELPEDAILFQEAST